MEINMAAEALRLAERYNFAVFPVQPPVIGDPKTGKLPLIKGWPEAATTDPIQIETWWSRRPNANIGVATGKKSDVWVLDVDVKHDGLASLDKLAAESGEDWLPTMTALTGSFGLHFYFRYDASRPVKNSVSKIAPGLDVRGDGGYVVAPPSLHAIGNRYTWMNQ